jgi:hypothetical protein
MTTPPLRVISNRKHTLYETHNKSYGLRDMIKVHPLKGARSKRYPRKATFTFSKALK